MSGIVKMIKALLGFGGSRAPTRPPISQLSFKNYSAESSIPHVASSKKIDINHIASADRKLHYEAVQRAKRRAEREKMMSSAMFSTMGRPKWTASQLLQLFDHGPSCQKETDWSGVVAGRSAYASKRAWEYVGSLPGCTR